MLAWAYESGMGTVGIGEWAPHALPPLAEQHEQPGKRKCQPHEPKPSQTIIKEGPELNLRALHSATSQPFAGGVWMQKSQESGFLGVRPVGQAVVEASCSTCLASTSKWYVFKIWKKSKTKY